MAPDTDPRVYAQGDPSTRVYFNMFVNEMLNVRERLHALLTTAGTSTRPTLPVGIPVDLEAMHWSEGAASKYTQLALFVAGMGPVLVQANSSLLYDNKLPLVNNAP